MESASRRTVVASMGLAVVTLLPAPCLGNEPQECITLNPKPRIEMHAVIAQSGCYTLGSSLHQGWLYSIPEGGRKPPGSSELILVWAPDVVIDFANHSLSTNTGNNGVILNPEQNPARRQHVPTSSVAATHRLELRNGTIRLLNDRFAVSGVTSRGVTAPEQGTYVHIRRQHYEPKPMPDVFPKVRYVLENLKIRTNDLAALLMGDGIVIRHCTIEVDGENALVIYGPNAIIEDNHIVFRRRPPARPGSPSYPEAPGAIYSRAADGAVVRRNTIELDRDDQEVAAIAVVDSRGVIVEGNRFNGDSNLVVRGGTSTATLRANTLKLGWARKDQALPNVDLE